MNYWSNWLIGYFLHWVRDQSLNSLKMTAVRKFYNVYVNDTYDIQTKITLQLLSSPQGPLQKLIIVNHYPPMWHVRQQTDPCRSCRLWHGSGPDPAQSRLLSGLVTAVVNYTFIHTNQFTVVTVVCRRNTRLYHGNFCNCVSLMITKCLKK